MLSWRTNFLFLLYLSTLQTERHVDCYTTPDYIIITDNFYNLDGNLLEEESFRNCFFLSTYTSRNVNSISSWLISTKKYLFGLVIDFRYIDNCTSLYEGSKYYDLNATAMLSDCLRSSFCEIVVHYRNEHKLKIKF